MRSSEENRGGVTLWETALSGQIHLGDKAFVGRMQTRAGLIATSGIPLLPGVSGRGYTQAANARITGLSVSRISRLIAAQEAKGKNGR